jgi:multidrug resistance efflux pump
MPDKPPRIPLWLKAVVVLALLGAGAAYAFILYSRPTALVETVVSGEAVNAKPGSVTVKEEYSMQMKSQIAGRVLNKDYHLDPGMRIKEGDILVQLDTGDVDIEIQQAQNAYASAKSKVAVGSAQKYALESAQSDFTNVERLYKLGQISESDYNKSRRAVQTIEQAQAMEDVLNKENLDSDENDAQDQAARAGEDDDHRPL